MATRKKTKPVSSQPERLMNKLGRPTKYRPEFCKIVIELGRIGKSKAQIAADERIDVSRVTLDEWCTQNPAFLYALTRARDLALAEWENKAENGIASVGFNSGLWGRIMSARFPDDYREVRELKADVTTREGVLVIGAVMSPEDWEAAARTQQEELTREHAG